MRNRHKSGTESSSYNNILNGKNLKMIENTPSPSQQDNLKPAPRVGFSFLSANGDKSQTMKYVTYRPAKIYRGRKWHVEYYYRDPESHEFIRFKVYENINRIKDLKDKEQFARDLRDAVNYHLEKGFNPFQEELKVVVKNWTVNQGLIFFKTNLSNRGLRHRTIQSYQSVLRFLYEYFPLQTPIKELSKIQVNAIFRQAYLKKKWSNVTFNNYIMFTRSIWNYLIEEEVTDSNPIKVKPLEETITRHKYFTREIFDKIKENADPELLEFMMFVYHTGTRPRRETAYMRYEYILRDRGLLLVPAKINKVKRDGYIPLSNYLLERYKEKEGRIFQYSGSHYNKLFSALKKKLELDPSHTIYAMKHTRAIHMVEDGATLDEIMRFFRHTNPRTTLKYLRELGAEVNLGVAEKGIKF